MNQNTFRSILSVGETVAVEFKRCGNGIEHDTYESVCSFLNRFGGDIFMGVLDDGTVIGIPEKAAPDMIKNFISVISNDSLFHPTVYLAPELIEFEGHTVIHVHVPPSSEVHSYKKVIYDRVDDADVKVTATGAIAAMYIRKQNVFTEKKVYPYATLEDLRLDLLPRVRQAAVNHAMGRHPWQDMDDMELLRSAGLYGTDIATGEKGFNLAAILLLGRDDIIQNVCPAYETDALVRRVNLDRYDDRETVRTNLIESYDFLMEFARKHLPDKFFLEGDIRISLRDVLAREMVSNTLMHREFVSSYTAKFVIMQDRMYTENANRAVKDGRITPDNLEPVSKNPIIASFFRNIGRADSLGSGVRNLFKYSRFYSGQDPQVSEGDVFRIIVPLNETYSYDYELGKAGEVTKVAEPLINDATKEPKSATKASKPATKEPESATKASKPATKEPKSATKEVKPATKASTGEIYLSKDELILLTLLHEKNNITQKQIHEETGIPLGTIKRILPRLQEKGILQRIGGRKAGKWQVNGQS